MRRFVRPVLAVLLLCAALTVLACGNDKKDDKAGSGDGAVSGLGAGSPSAGSSGSSPTAGASGAGGLTPDGFPEPNDGVLLQRLVVPAAKVDHPVEIKGVNARGEMELPTGRDGIAWYDFSAFPGYGNNAVFSGHLDWFTGELGVFGRMRDLKEGDEATVVLSDGMELRYRVAKIEVYKVADAPVKEIVGPTTKDTLTFITCDGAFNRDAQDYSHRRIIRAERTA